MKRYWTAALAVALLSACAPRLSAMTFLPVISGPDVDAAGGKGAVPPVGAQLVTVAIPSKLRMSLMAAAWEMPSVNVGAITGFAGDQIEFEPMVMPLVALEYRLNRSWGVGGWYNPMNTDFRLKGPTAELLTSGTNPRLNSDRLATASLNMYAVHVSHFFPRNVALQAGIMNYHGAVTAWVPNPRQPGNINLRAAQGGTELQIWGYKSYKIWGYASRPSYFTGGLGVRRRLSSETDSAGPDTTANASATFTYFPRENVSIDVSAWLADWSHHDAFSVRLNGGLTGHF